MEDLIYIVEDDEGIRELYEGAFDGVYKAEMFETGNDFFKAFEKKRPSLIILDIMLPDMDGYTILTKNCFSYIQQIILQKPCRKSAGLYFIACLRLRLLLA